MSWYCFKRDGCACVDELEIGTDESVIEVMRRHGYHVAWPIGMPREYVPQQCDPRQQVLPLPEGWRLFVNGEQQ